MGQTNEVATVSPAQSSRSGASRKLLARKSLARTVSDNAEPPLEASFPTTPLADIAEPPSEALSSASGMAHTPSPRAPAAWSSADEAGLQALLTRRKAAGYQRRGNDLSAQVLRPGGIKPNPDTIAATIVSLVAKRRELSRAELLSLMASATFPHPKAQPENKGWCQGYVSGAIRNGFLAIAAESSTQDQEA